MGDDVTRFCVSWVTMWVIREAIQQFLLAWNCHRIPGPNGGVHSILANNSATTSLLPNSIPSTAEMIRIHERDGARLTRETAFGRDPLRNNPNLQILRERDFSLILALFLKIFFMETVDFSCFTSFYSPEDLLHCMLP